MRTIKMFLMVFICCISLTSCLKSTQLSDLAIVEGIGIDVVEKNYVITVEYFTPTTSKAEAVNTQYIKQSSESISKAIQEINSKIGKRLYFGQNNIIVLGNEAAKYRILDILNFFDVEPNTKASICVAVSEIAEKIINYKNEENSIPKTTLQKIISDSSKAGNCCEYRLFKIIDSSKTGRFVMLPELKISGNGYFEVSGSSVFKIDN